MNEIKLFYENGEEIEDLITFKPIQAGKSETKTIDIKNTTKYNLTTNIIIKGDINKEENQEIKPNATIPLNIEIQTDKKANKPIKAEIIIKIEYTIR